MPDAGSLDDATVEPPPIAYRPVRDEEPAVAAPAEVDPGTRAHRDFVVPDLGEGLEDATIVEWQVAPGDVVHLNQTLCVLETAKATVDVPSPFGGVVVELGGAPNDTLAVGALLVRIAVDDAGGGGPTLVGYGPEPSRGARRRRRTATPTPPAEEPRTRPRARPPVRKLARDLGIDLASIVPTGPGDVVTRDDVLAASSRQPAVSRRAAPEPVRAGQTIAVSGVRARIAQHMTASRSRIPDATCSVVVDCTRLLALRSTMNTLLERRGEELSITPFGLMCWLLVPALLEAPLLNATFVDATDSAAAEIRVHGSVHLGIATATDRGLIVPVVRDAERRSWRDLAAEINRVTSGARAGTLPPTELQGSTVTVSNFGALGLDDGIPVINHPEAAIIGIGSIKPRPQVVDGVVVPRPTASVTLAFDHRVADGADAGRLLSAFRELVETPEIRWLDQ